MLAHLTAADREAIAASLARVRSILAAPPKPQVRIERVRASSDEALGILHEYYEAVHVVQRDTPASIEKMLRAPCLRNVAGISGRRIQWGVSCCANLIQFRTPRNANGFISGLPRAETASRDKLLDAMEEFARSRQIKWIYLDTYDDLKTAIALYERRGYTRCERYNDNPQATLFMRKHLD